MVSVNRGNELRVVVRHAGIVPSSQPRADDTEPEAVYRKHFAFVWRSARRLGADDSWLDDAVHEVFLAATRRIAEFRGSSNIRTWLFAIAVRVVQRMRRDRARHVRRIERLSAQLDRPSDEPERVWQSRRYLRELLLRLEEGKRVVVVMAELEGMTSAEIACELGVPVGTIDSRLRAARRDLLRMIRRDEAKERRRTR